MKKNTFNRICAAILAIVTVFLLIPVGMLPTFAEEPKIWNGTVASGFASGTGTESDPYLIKTAEQLAYLAKTVNDGTTYEGKYFKLGNDIALNDTANWENWGTTAPKNTWTAIGGYSDSSDYPFSGTFDGDGHTVSGIYVYTEADAQGLFGYAYNAAIKNLGVEKSYIKGGVCVGGVAGQIEYSDVSNCYNTGTVSGYNFVGGVVGFNYYGTVSNCYNTGTMSEAGYVGGVVGENIGGTVSDCYNTGEVSGNNFVGGVVGVNCDYGTVSNCHNTGEVIGEGYNVGGVVGRNHNGSTVSNCYNTGTVSGCGVCVGGVVGLSNGDPDTVTVSNCYNTGEVIGSDDYVGGVVGRSYNGTVSNCHNTGTVSGDDFVGGVVGENYDGTVSDCYNTGAVSGIYLVGGVVGRSYNGAVSNCYNTGTVGGRSSVGGVVGKNDAISGTAMVSNCYNTGEVIGEGSDVGGVAGYNYDGTVSDCYNTGAVSGISLVGGVAGLNEAHSGTAMVSNCYNTGEVIGSGNYVGGVCGVCEQNSHESIITNCYYLTGCAKDGNGTVQHGEGSIIKGRTTDDVSGQITGLTNTQMKQKKSFVGFDFETVWTMDGNPEYPNPELKDVPMVAPTCTKGDINGDDTIDAFDYQMLKAFVLGTFKDVTDEQKEAMDVNYDGCADAFDYQMVKAHVLGTYVIQ